MFSDCGGCTEYLTSHAQKYHQRNRSATTSYIPFPLSVLDELNATIDDIRASLGFEWTAPPFVPNELSTGDEEGVQEVDRDGHGNTEVVEEEVVITQDPWMAELRWFENEVLEQAVEDSEGMMMSNESRSSTPTASTSESGPSDERNGEDAEPPFVTDGRGRVVGDGCITI